MKCTKIRGSIGALLIIISLLWVRLYSERANYPHWIADSCFAVVTCVIAIGPFIWYYESYVKADYDGPGFMIWRILFKVIMTIPGHHWKTLSLMLSLIGLVSLISFVVLLLSILFQPRIISKNDMVQIEHPGNYTLWVEEGEGVGDPALIKLRGDKGRVATPLEGNDGEEVWIRNGIHRKSIGWVHIEFPDSYSIGGNPKASEIILTPTISLWRLAALSSSFMVSFVCLALKVLIFISRTWRRNIGVADHSGRCAN